MTSQLLRDLFRPMGEIEQVKLCRNKKTQLPMGYGFVKFKYAADAAKAVRQLNGRMIQEKHIKVSFARPSSEIIKVITVFYVTLCITVNSEHELVRKWPSKALH